MKDSISTTARRGATQSDVGSSSSRSDVRGQSWLRPLLTCGKHERFCQILTITPQMAADLLELNTSNRPVTRAAVAEYTAALAAGRWKLTAEAVSITKDGVLLDAQHRLMAIVQSGCSAPMTVWFGCENDEFRVGGKGRKRGAADDLAILKYGNVRLHAALAGMLLMILTPGKATFSTDRVVEFAEQMDPAITAESCRWGQTLNKTTNPTAAALAVWMILTTSPNAQRLGAFLQGMTSGVMLVGTKAQLRDFLTRGVYAKSNGQGATIKRAAAIMLAWNHWLTGRTRGLSLDWPHYKSLPDVK